MSAAAPDDELRQVVQDLLYAIAIGDLGALEALWCAEGSLFFQFGQPPGLIVGRAAVLERFGRMFTQLAGRVPGPPYIRFKIEEIAAVTIDARHAAVYATVTVDGRIGRRTLIVRREPQAMRILHLHASNFSTERAPEAGVA
jgi:hypothetical protein